MVKTRLKRLKAVLPGVRKLLIVIYGNPDPDALASAWALKELVASFGVTGRIGYTGEVGRLENRTMIDLLRIPAGPVSAQEAAKAGHIALVDAQPEFFKSFELPRCDILFDHHPVGRRRAYPFSDIRPDCLATASILTEYLAGSGIRIGRKLATALYYGIQSDSQHLRRWPTPTDIAALDHLQKKADLDMVRRIEFSSYSLRLLDFFSVALIRLRYAAGVVFSYIGPVAHADICVQVADFLTRVKEARWALVAGVVGSKLVIVFRCDGHHKHAGRTAQGAFGAAGSSGGHADMARAEIEAANLPPEAMLTDNESMEKYILGRLCAVEKEFRPLLRAIKAYYRDK